MGNWLLPGPPGHQFPEPSQESAVLLPGGEADAESSQLRARKEARGQPASHHSPRAVPCTPADVCTEFSTSATVHSTTLAFQVLWLHAPHVVQGHLQPRPPLHLAGCQCPTDPPPHLSRDTHLLPRMYAPLTLWPVHGVSHTPPSFHFCMWMSVPLLKAGPHTPPPISTSANTAQWRHLSLPAFNLGPFPRHVLSYLHKPLLSPPCL